HSRLRAGWRDRSARLWLRRAAADCGHSAAHDRSGYCAAGARPCTADSARRRVRGARPRPIPAHPRAARPRGPRAGHPHPAQGVRRRAAQRRLRTLHVRARALAHRVGEEHHVSEKPTPLGEALKQYLERSGLGERVEEAAIVPEWGERVGPAIAAVTTTLRVSRGSLVVAVRSSAWLMELKLMERDIE